MGDITPTGLNQGDLYAFLQRVVDTVAALKAQLKLHEMCLEELLAASGSPGPARGRGSPPGSSNEGNHDPGDDADSTPDLSLKGL